MDIILSFILIGLLGYCAIMLILAAFTKPRKPKFGRAGLSFAAFFLLASYIAEPPAPVASTAASSTKTEPNPTAAPAKSSTEAAEVASEPETIPVPDAPSPSEKYVERLNREIESAPKFNVRGFTGRKTDLMLALAVISAWSDIYREGANLSLTEQQEARRQEFRRIASAKQVEAFPILRDAYGPIMRAELWEADGKARTFGKGFRTVEFVNGLFAANRNIKVVHEDLQPSLLMFRFTRAEYKWIPNAHEFSYFTLKPPADGDLVEWHSTGSFVRLD